MSTSLALARNPVSDAERVIAEQSVEMEEVQDGWERALSTTGSVLHFAQEREIYTEGDEAETFFKIISGVVRTCKFLSDGRRQIDAFHVEGDIFGFEPGDEHRLSAEAVSDCTVIAYRRRGVERLAANNDALSRQLFSYAVCNMARARDHSLLLGRKGAAEKVAAFLMRMGGSLIERRRRHVGDDAAGHRRLSGPDDRDRLAHPLAVGTGLHNRALHRAPDSLQEPCGVACAQCMTAPIGRQPGSAIWERRRSSTSFISISTGSLRRPWTHAPPTNQAWPGRHSAEASCGGGWGEMGAGDHSKRRPIQ